MILAFNVSSYLVQSRVRNLTDQARFLAQTVQLEVQRATTPEALAETLERRQSSSETRYPFLSIAVVPVSNLTCKVDAGASRARAANAAGAAARHRRAVGAPAAAERAAEVGRLRRLQRADRLQRAAKPATSAQPAQTRLVMRAVALPEVPNPAWAVILDMPLSTIDRAAHPAGNRHPHGRDHARLSRAACTPIAGRADRGASRRRRRRPAAVVASRRAGSCSSITSTGPTGEPESASVGILINTLRDLRSHFGGVAGRASAR